MDLIELGIIAGCFFFALWTINPNLMNATVSFIFSMLSAGLNGLAVLLGGLLGGKRD